MRTQRSPLLIFLLLLLVITSQNGQTSPVHHKHATAPAHKKHATAPARKKHAAAPAHNRHSKMYVHKKNGVTASNKRDTKRLIQRVEVMPDSLRRMLINSEKNRISNPEQLARLKEKLQKAVSSKKKIVKIVHIGDSHIQADMMTRVLRLGLQYRYGNAGRGIVFPSQVAKTNGPSDIFSFSNTSWLSGRLSLTNSPVECGVCGYGLQSNSQDWSLEIRSKPERGDEDSFDIVRLFTGKNTGCLTIRYNETEKNEVCMKPKNNFDMAEVALSMKTNSLSFASNEPNSTPFTFYGASFEKKKASGVIYHSIGVNGAEFDSYNRDPLFFDQIAELNADCYIISLGTNEAQRQNLNTEDFALQVRSLLTNLRKISPDAVFIITTPPPSFLKSVAINPKIRTITEVLTRISNEEKISLWDIYGIMDGDKGVAMFQTYGLYRPDLIHFNKAGYELQGFMLLSALLKSTL